MTENTKGDFYLTENIQMCFHTDCRVTESDALRRISEMIHCEFLIPVQAERRDWNLACVACVCIQDKQKTLLRPTGQRSPSVVL